MRKPTQTYLRSLRTGRALLPALCSAWLVGCAPTSYHQSHSAVKSIDVASAQLQTEIRSLNAAEAALSDLANNPAADLRPQLTRFSHSLDQLIVTAERTDAIGQEMARENKQYFDMWKAQIATLHFDSIRERSDSRRADVTNRFEKVSQRYLDTQAVVRPVIAYLEDLRTALQTDMTSAGLEALKPTLVNANENMNKVKLGLGQLAAGMANPDAIMNSVTTTAENTP